MGWEIISGICNLIQIKKIDTRRQVITWPVEMQSTGAYKDLFYSCYHDMDFF